MCLNLDEILFNQLYVALLMQWSLLSWKLEIEITEWANAPISLEVLHPMNEIFWFPIERCVFIRMNGWEISMRRRRNTSKAHPFCPESKRAVHVDMHTCMRTFIQWMISVTIHGMQGPLFSPSEWHIHPWKWMRELSIKILSPGPCARPIHSSI